MKREAEVFQFQRCISTLQMKFTLIIQFKGEIETLQMSIYFPLKHEIFHFTHFLMRISFHLESLFKSNVYTHFG